MVSLESRGRLLYPQEEGAEFCSSLHPDTLLGWFMSALLVLSAAVAPPPGKFLAAAAVGELVSFSGQPKQPRFRTKPFFLLKEPLSAKILCF